MSAQDKTAKTSIRKKIEGAVTDHKYNKLMKSPKTSDFQKEVLGAAQSSIHRTGYKDDATRGVLTNHGLAKRFTNPNSGVDIVEEVWKAPGKFSWQD